MPRNWVSCSLLWWICHLVYRQNGLYLAQHGNWHFCCRVRVGEAWSCPVYVDQFGCCHLLMQRMFGGLWMMNYELDLFLSCLVRANLGRLGPLLVGVVNASLWEGSMLNFLESAAFDTDKVLIKCLCDLDSSDFSTLILLFPGREVPQGGDEWVFVIPLGLSLWGPIGLHLVIAPA